MKRAVGGSRGELSRVVKLLGGMLVRKGEEMESNGMVPMEFFCLWPHDLAGRDVELWGEMVSIGDIGSMEWYLWRI